MKRWCITIHQPYMDLIQEGRKTVELRMRLPKGIGIGDIVYACLPRSNGEVRLSFVVGEVLAHTPDYMWRECGEQMQISEDRFKRYCQGRDVVFGLRMEEVICYTKNPVCVRDLGLKVAPMWFCKVK